MPSTVVTSIGNTGVQWYITDLSSLWDSNSYQYAYITINGSSSSPVYSPSPTGTGYTTGTGSFSGLTQNTTYTANGFVVAANGVAYSTGSTTFTTQGVPIGTPSVSASALTGKQLSISWSSVSGATNYNIFVDNFYKASTAGTSVTVSIDKEYYLYPIAVTPTNGYGTGSSGTTTVRSLDEIAPSVYPPTTGTVTSTSIVLNVSGYDTTPSQGNASGLSGFYLYRNGSFFTTVYQSGGNASYTFTGLTASTTYTLGAQAFDVQGNGSDIKSISVTTPAAVTRPSNFTWSSAKTQGQNFNLTASEWTSLCSKINEFRTYKGLATYSFTSVASGDTFFFWIFNQAVTAISAMSPPTSAPSSVSSGDTVTASAINRLRDSLNSIP
jgi:hypothetical protein